MLIRNRKHTTQTPSSIQNTNCSNKLTAQQITTISSIQLRRITQYKNKQHTTNISDPGKQLFDNQEFNMLTNLRVCIFKAPHNIK